MAYHEETQPLGMQSLMVLDALANGATITMHRRGIELPPENTDPYPVWFSLHSGSGTDEAIERGVIGPLYRRGLVTLGRRMEQSRRPVLITNLGTADVIGRAAAAIGEHIAREGVTAAPLTLRQAGILRTMLPGVQIRQETCNMITSDYRLFDVELSPFEVRLLFAIGMITMGEKTPPEQRNELGGPVWWTLTEHGAAWATANPYQETGA